MTPRRRSIRSRCFPALALLAGIAGLALPAGANEGAERPPRQSEVDSEHMFGFTVGSDIEEPGSIVPHFNTAAAFGRRGRLYSVIDQNFELKYGLAPGVAVAAAFNGIAARARGVPGLPDTYSGGASGVGLSARFQILDRQKSPVGLTLDVNGGYDSRDPGTARAATVWSGGVRAAFDSELIYDRLFAAVNIGLDTQTRASADLPWTERSSGTFVAASVSARLAPGVFVGLEASYRRAYEGQALGRFQGDAFYLGPSIYLTSGRSWLTLSVATQIRGHEVGGSSGLNLREFERHRVLLVFGKPL
ncbi:MAG: hypothetical protein LCH88_08320 [Proteobacteria bacterium]|nr:hypothetical protein [Pseudomonadota bacterium]